MIVQVEDTLFKVPKRTFEENSEVFRNMFAIPCGANSTEGVSDDRPIVLQGIKLADFRTLLQVMFRP